MSAFFHVINFVLEIPMRGSASDMEFSLPTESRKDMQHYSVLGFTDTKHSATTLQPNSY